MQSILLDVLRPEQQARSPQLHRLARVHLSRLEWNPLYNRALYHDVNPEIRAWIRCCWMSLTVAQLNSVQSVAVLSTYQRDMVAIPTGATLRLPPPIDQYLSALAYHGRPAQLLAETGEVTL